MAQFTTTLGDNLRTVTVWEETGEKVVTDAPVVFQGLGELISPSDLVGIGLSACVLTIVGLEGKTRGYDFSQARVRVDKELSDPPTVRVSKLHVHVTLPATVPAAERPAIEHSLANCPVGLSLSPDIDRRLEVEWV